MGFSVDFFSFTKTIPNKMHKFCWFSRFNSRFLRCKKKFYVCWTVITKICHILGCVMDNRYSKYRWLISTNNQLIKYFAEKDFAQSTIFLPLTFFTVPTPWFFGGSCKNSQLGFSWSFNNMDVPTGKVIFFKDNERWMKTRRK